jgi:hypothetical protein
VKQVFVASDITEAHLIKGLLESHGMAATVRGADLLAARGDVPIPDLWPTVWISEDDREAEARSLVSDYQAAQPLAAAPGWRCPQCGQEREAQFTACWQCGAERPLQEPE